jgi:hypothetical protein
MLAWVVSARTAAPWYNGSESRRPAITISRAKVSGPLAHFPALINLTNNSSQHYAHTGSTCQACPDQTSLPKEHAR